MADSWSPPDYARHAAFVPALGASVFERLAPCAGQRILDLGCGDGALTRRIAACGATVVGVDSSPAMVAAARAAGIDAREGDATRLSFREEFDAVFSNAALHWVLDAPAAAAGVFRALRPGGRLVAELGGHGNVAAIAVAARAVLDAEGVRYTWPWYFPTAAEYAALLEAQGFVVAEATLVPRPTPLPTDMAGWLDTFGVSLLSGVPGSVRRGLRDRIVERLAPVLCDREGRWTADYVRLRVEAWRPRPASTGAPAPA